MPILRSRARFPAIPIPKFLCVPCSNEAYLDRLHREKPSQCRNEAVHRVSARICYLMCTGHLPKFSIRSSRETLKILSRPKHSWTTRAAVRPTFTWELAALLVPGKACWSKMKMNSFGCGGAKTLALCACEHGSKVVGWESWFLQQLRSIGDG